MSLWVKVIYKTAQQENEKFLKFRVTPLLDIVLNVEDWGELVRDYLCEWENFPKDGAVNIISIETIEQEDEYQ